MLVHFVVLHRHRACEQDAEAVLVCAARREGDARWRSHDIPEGTVEGQKHSTNPADLIHHGLSVRHSVDAVQLLQRPHCQPTPKLSQSRGTPLLQC